MKKILIVLILILLTACNGSSQSLPEDLVPINVCYSALSGTQATTWYAYENGIFEKYGLRVNLVSMSGGTAAVTALLTGDMDICQVASPSVVNAVGAGQDIVLIAGLINTVPGSLFSQPEITSPEMLRGKIIGIHQGSSTEAITRIILNELGFDPDSDVILLNIGGEPERLAAMEARQIDAAFMIPPLTEDLRSKGYTELFNAVEVGIPYQGTSIATSGSFLSENRDRVINFMKAIVDAIHQIKGDPEGSMEVLAQYLEMDLEMDKLALQESYDLILLQALQSIPYPTLDGLQVVIDLAAVDNPDIASLTPEEVVNITILQELEETGFISSLK